MLAPEGQPRIQTVLESLSPALLVVAIAVVLTGAFLLARAGALRRWRGPALARARARALRSETRLAESEQRFRDFAEASSDWFWEMGPDLRFTFMSERLRAVLGFDPDYMIGKRREELSDLTLEPERWARHIADLEAHRPFRDFKYKLVLPDQRVRHISVSGKPVFGAGGRFLGYRGTGRDVTEEVVSEQKLQRQSDFILALVEKLPIGVSVVDAGLRLVAFNDRFLELLDFPRDRFKLGDPFEKFIRFNAERGEYGPGDVDQLVRDRLALAGEPKPHQFVRKRPDGRAIDIRGTPLDDGGFITTYIDITERQSAEERLRESELRFRDFAESSSDWLWQQDAELRFTYMSPGGLERFGFKAEDFIGRKRDETMPLGVTPEQWDAHQRDLEARRPFRDLKLFRLDAHGRHHWCSVSGWPIFDEERRFAGYRGTGRDITAEVEADHRANLAQRRLSMAAESLSDALAFFDADDRLVTCNEAFRHINGPARDHVVPGARFEDLLRAATASGQIPQSQSDQEAFVQARLAYHRDPSGTLQRQLADGSWYQIREQRTSDGGTALIATDITEIKRQQAELARKTSTIEATFANMGEGIAVFDRDLRLVTCNRRWQELLQAPDSIARAGASFSDLMWHLANRGDFGAEDKETAVATRVARARSGEPYRMARWYPGGRFLEVRRTPTPDGGLISVMSDLTEVKAAEERFKDFAEATSDWFWEQDAELRFTYVSPGVYQKSGIRAEEHIGKTRQQTRPLGVSDQQWAAHLADIGARRPFRDFQLQRVDPEGRLRTLAIGGKPLFDTDGRFLGYRGSGADVTDRIEAEERARLAQARFDSAIETLHDAIAIFDVADRLVMCNLAYRRAVGGGDGLLRPGTTFEEILRFNVIQGNLASIADKERFIAHRLAQHRNPGEPIQLRRADGGWLQIREQRLADGGTAVIGTDITATKQREQELFEKTEILQRTLANMGEGIIVFDRDMNLIAWNDRAIELLGMPPGFLRVGLSYEAYLRMQAERGEYGGEEIEAAVRKRVARAREPTPHFVGRYRPNGRFIELRRNPMPGGGFVSLYSDATERKRAEDALRDAKEAAEIANRTKSEFLANMSHELRTPLNAIIGFSEIIQQELFGAIGSDRYKEYASDIYDSGTHLLNLINDILDVSKAEAGKVELQETRVPIESVIEASLRLIAPRAREAGIHLSIPRVDHLPLLYADERRLKQVLLNLLSNAVKFTAAGGRVTLEAAIQEPAGFVIRVIDTGIGIAAEDIPRALEPFGQVDSRLSRKYEGTGLGLPLSKGLVELHGGRLEIASEVGVGTTVTVILPPERILPRDSGATVHRLRRQSR